MKKLIYILLLMAVLMIAPQFADFAMGQPPPPPIEPIPIDGGLGLLLLAGVAYGAKKLYNDQEV